MATESGEVLHRLDMKDEQIFRLGDVIDVKASIALIVITFLATQTADFLKDGRLLPALHVLQLVSAISVTVAGALALCELWPRDYEVESSGMNGWKQELRAYYQHDEDADQKVENEFRAGQIRLAIDRIRANTNLNEQKSLFLIWSFRCTGVALALNLITLVVKAAG